MQHGEIVEIFKAAGALTTGHFQLASGRHSGHYVQTAQLSQYPDRLETVLRARLADIAALGDVSMVFSPAIGALPIGQQLGLLLGCRALFAERDKENNLRLRRGFTIGEGDAILLVEDVMTTGGTLLELKKIADQHGAAIKGLFVLVNRSGMTEWEGVPMISVAEFSFPTYESGQCPLCGDGVLLTRPGTKAVIGRS